MVSMSVGQNINRVDHVVLMVRPENLEACVERLANVLGAEFEYFVHEPQGLRGAISLQSGLEVITPTRDDCMLSRQLAEHGEGINCIIYGVRDADEAKARAERHGMPTYRIHDALGPGTSEFTVEHFQAVRECHFKERIFGALFVASQIEPRQPSA
jgi:4-hydroxyphenylpyruvate dioxygenase-like putative hemolysin